MFKTYEKRNRRMAFVSSGLFFLLIHPVLVLLTFQTDDFLRSHLSRLELLEQGNKPQERKHWLYSLLPHKALILTRRQGRLTWVPTKTGVKVNISYGETASLCCSHPGLKWALNLMTCVLIGKGRGRSDPLKKAVRR